MEGKKTTLINLMNDATFMIPSYQRDYDWSPENVEDLLYDLSVTSELNQYPLFLLEQFKL